VTQRGTVSRKPAKTKHRKPTRPRRRDAAKAARETNLSVSDLQKRMKRQARELEEAREQQAATSEVLRVISSSPTDLAPVFDTILTNATRLCEGNFAFLCRYDGDVLVGEATCDGTPEFTEKFMGLRITLGREGPTRLAALERRTVHVADMTVEPGFSPMAAGGNPWCWPDRRHRFSGRGGRLEDVLVGPQSRCVDRLGAEAAFERGQRETR
jgi:hypothetical protein